MIVGSSQWDILIEVAEERQWQDEKWGGTEHDDTHTRMEWELFIHSQMGQDKDHYRQEMVRVAALAVAAIESYDRMEKK